MWNVSPVSSSINNNERTVSRCRITYCPVAFYQFIKVFHDCKWEIVREHYIQFCIALTYFSTLTVFFLNFVYYTYCLQIILGIKLSDHLLDIVIQRHTDPSDKINLESFLCLMLRLRSMTSKSVFWNIYICTGNVFLLQNTFSWVIMQLT